MSDASPPPTVAEVTARARLVRQRIAAAGRNPDDVTVVAVTKGFPVGAVRAALAAGFEDIGENYAAELVAKAEALSSPVGTWAPGSGPEGRTGDGTRDEPTGAPPAPVPRWHFLGAVQRRKVRGLAPHVSCWHGVCRPVEAEAIAAASPGAAVFVEVDTTGRPERNGVEPKLVPQVVEAARGEGLTVRGLMVVAPPGPLDVARATFRLVAALARDCGLDDLSMGMSDDLEVAVEEGATVVRIGRALFGDRPARP